MTFCHKYSGEVVSLLNWLPLPPNLLSFSFPKHIKQIFCKKWYSFTNCTQHSFTSESMSYGTNWNWISCLNEPQMFCSSYRVKWGGGRGLLFEFLAFTYWTHNFTCFKALSYPSFFLSWKWFLGYLSVVRIQNSHKSLLPHAEKFANNGSQGIRLLKNDPFCLLLHHPYQVLFSLVILHSMYKSNFMYLLSIGSTESYPHYWLDVFSDLWK